jgi:hypothetical protein
MSAVNFTTSRTANSDVANAATRTRGPRAQRDLVPFLLVAWVRVVASKGDSLLLSALTVTRNGDSLGVSYSGGKRFGPLGPCPGTAFRQSMVTT